MVKRVNDTFRCYVSWIFNLHSSLSFNCAFVDPPLLNIPKSKGSINTLLFKDELKTHPGLMAALQSLRNKRSSKNAYILLLGLTGSGKSSAVSETKRNDQSVHFFCKFKLNDHQHFYIFFHDR